VHRVQVCSPRDEDISLCACAGPGVYHRRTTSDRKESQRCDPSICEKRARHGQPATALHSGCAVRRSRRLICCLRPRCPTVDLDAMILILRIRRYNDFTLRVRPIRPIPASTPLSIIAGLDLYNTPSSRPTSFQRTFCPGPLSTHARTQTYIRRTFCVCVCVCSKYPPTIFTSSLFIYTYCTATHLP